MSSTDKQILRDLAKRVAEISGGPGGGSKARALEETQCPQGKKTHASVFF